MRGTGADIVRMQIRVKTRDVTIHATSLRKYFFATFSRCGKLAMHQIRAGHRLERFKVFINGDGNGFRLVGEQNEFDSRAHGGLGIGAHAQVHHRRHLMHEQHVFGVLGIADAVIEQIPIHAVHARVAGMTARTTLPALQTNGCVMKIKLPLPHHVHFRLGAERHGFGLKLGGARSIALNVSEK